MRPITATPLFSTAALLSAPIVALAVGTGDDTSSIPTEFAQQLRVGLESHLEVTGTFGDTLVCHADADRRPDALAMVGDNAVVVFAPDTRQTAKPLMRGGVRDVAVLANTGSVDRLLSVGDRGLVSSTYTLDALGGDDGFLNQVIAEGHWVDAVDLQTADVDGDGDEDILGLDLGRQQVHVLRNDAVAGFSTAPSIDLPIDSVRIVPLRWRAIDRSSIAVVDSNVVKVVGRDGIVQASFSFVDPVVDLIALDEENVDLDAFVVLTSAGSTNSTITVVRPGTGPEAPVDLAGLAAARIGLANVDGSGQPDLVLSACSTNRILYLLHRGMGGVTFAADTAGLGTIEIAPDGVDMTGQTANPIATDFDGDGDDDFFMLVQPTGDGVMQRGFARDERQFHPGYRWSNFDLTPGDESVQLLVDVPRYADGRRPREVDVEVWSTPVDGLGFATMVGRDVAKVDATKGTVVTSVALDRQPGDEIWIHLRGFDRAVDGVTLARVGVESAFRYKTSAISMRGGGGGGGGTGSDSGQGGDGDSPPNPPE